MTHATTKFTMVAMLWLLLGAAAVPGRSGDMEARRRSAIDRSAVRFGRSYPHQPTAAEIRESLLRPNRKDMNFVRLGRSQSISSEDLVSLLKNYEDYDNPDKRSASFIRLGRDPRFIRFGRDPSFIRFGRDPSFIRLGKSDNQAEDNGYPERINRARDSFIRLGRDSEEFNNDDDEERRNKRSTEDSCEDCQS